MLSPDHKLGFFNGRNMDWQQIERVKYDKQRYCCEHFLIDIYRELTGIDLTNKLLTSGFFNAQKLRNFRQVETPKQLTIVLFRDKAKAHVGLWYDNKVLHLSEQGVLLQPLDMAKMGFKRVNFYETA